MLRAGGIKGLKTYERLARSAGDLASYPRAVRLGLGPKELPRHGGTFLGSLFSGDPTIWGSIIRGPLLLQTPDEHNASAEPQGPAEVMAEDANQGHDS